MEILEEENEEGLQTQDEEGREGRRMTRYIDADALAHDLEQDVELCAMALDDMNIVGKGRDDMQWEKDCKQNCIWYISEQPTVEAIPIEFIRSEIKNSKGFYNSSLRRLLDVWTERKEE